MGGCVYLKFFDVLFFIKVCRKIFIGKGMDIEKFKLDWLVVYMYIIFYIYVIINKIFYWIFWFYRLWIFEKLVLGLICGLLCKWIVM